MRPRKGSQAEKLGIKFTGNPDAMRLEEKKLKGGTRVKEIIARPGKHLVGSLS